MTMLVVGALACSSGDERLGRSDDVGPDSETAGSAYSAYTPSSWRIAERAAVEIGADPGPENELARVVMADRYTDGYVVATGLPISVRLYSESGRYQRTLGQAGDGPGEYRSIVRAWVTPGDTVVVYDPTLGRITYFAADGALLRTVPHRVSMGTMPGREGPRVIVDRFSDGSFLTRPNTTIPATDVDGGIARSSATLVRIAPELGLVDTIVTVLDQDVTLESFPFGNVWMSVPFSRRTSAVAFDTLVYVADNGRFEVQLRSFDSLVGRYRNRVTPTPVTDAIWNRTRDQELASWEAQIAASGNPLGLDVAAELEETRKRFRQARRLPTLPTHSHRILVDEVGNLWIQAWSSGPVPSRDWHVFLVAEERFTGLVTMPARFRPTRIKADAVIGVHMDELDVETVREYAIIR